MALGRSSPTACGAQRKTTHLLVNGMNIILISKLLGHTNVRTTQYYLDLNLMQLQREIRAKHPRERMEKKLVQKEEHHEV